MKKQYNEIKNIITNYVKYYWIIILFLIIWTFYISSSLEQNWLKYYQIHNIDDQIGWYFFIIFFILALSLIPIIILTIYLKTELNKIYFNIIAKLRYKKYWLKSINYINFISELKKHFKIIWINDNKIEIQVNNTNKFIWSLIKKRKIIITNSENEEVF